MPRRFHMDIRVRLSETDAIGVVYYGQYLTYFDISRLELLRKAGITPEFLNRRKLKFVAAESTCKYLSSARFDEVLTLGVKVARIGDSSVVYSHEIRRGRTKIAEGKVIDVLIGKDGQPAKFPDDVRKRLTRFAA
jgi:acyl-CoA thioester hydrolase